MAKAELDGELDIFGTHLEAILALGVSLDNHTAELRKLLKAQDEYQKRGPLFVPLQGQVTIDANGDPGVIDLGGPAYGQDWEIRQLVIGGLTWATTAMGNAIAAVQSSAPPINQTPGLSAIQDHAASLPSVAFYSANQFHVRHPNRVYIIILSGTAGQQYQAAGDAFNVPDVAAGQVFSG